MLTEEDKKERHLILIHLGSVRTDLSPYSNCSHHQVLHTIGQMSSLPLQLHPGSEMISDLKQCVSVGYVEFAALADLVLLQRGL